MVVGIVLASHGALAEGVLSSGQMIFGQQQDVFAVTLTPEMGPKDFRGRLDQAIASVSDQEHLLFLVDLKGGTPYNQVRLLLEEGSHEDWVAVTGLNLPMLLSAYETRDGAETAAQVASSVYQGAKIGVTITPDSLTPHEALTVAPASASGSKITPSRAPSSVTATSSARLRASTPACCTGRWLPHGQSRCLPPASLSCLTAWPGIPCARH